MSMTRAEIIKAYEGAVFDSGLAIAAGNEEAERDYELLKAGLDALRGPTREMVERMFPGCKMCKPVCHKCKSYPLALYPQACKTCVEHSKFEAASNFCEDCGRPMTEEALDMALRRLEELYK